jgi:hypothetical protein
VRVVHAPRVLMAGGKPISAARVIHCTLATLSAVTPLPPSSAYAMCAWAAGMRKSAGARARRSL